MMSSELLVPRKGAKFWLGLTLSGVMALALVPLYADYRSSKRVPAPSELRSIQEALRADFQPGDRVRVQPSWWLEPYEGLRGLDEATSTWPFPALLRSEELDRLEASLAQRLYVIDGFDREVAAPQGLKTSLSKPETLAGTETIRLTRWELESVRSLQSLSQELGAVKVLRGPTDKPLPCLEQRGEHQCPGESFRKVRLEQRVVGRHETFWVFAHPATHEVLELRWPLKPKDAEVKERWLFIRVGPTFEAVGHPEGQEVRLEVQFGSKGVLTYALPPHDFELYRFALRVPDALTEVSFRLSTEDASWREIALEANILDRITDDLRTWAHVVVDDAYESTSSR